MVRDKKKTFWRILKIDRTDPNELNLFEDPTRYTHEQIVQLKKWISRGNQEYGGLRAETTCYGIIGFVKFLGPYYMLKKVGEICGHTVYGVVDSQMIMIPYHSGEARVAGKHRENILLEDFRKAIWIINGCMKENYLEAIHFDLHEHYKRCCIYIKHKLVCLPPKNFPFFLEYSTGADAAFDNPIPNQDEEAISAEKEGLKADIFKLQKGVLRSNCLDCLDRTNFAQYANGLVVLDHQLHLLGIRGPPVVDTNNPLAEKLMEAYEKMGHLIAMQYAGSDAHTKMFSALRGDWNMMMKHRDMLTAVHRYHNNAYQDSEKQDAINVFLGKFKPQLGRPALWELHSDQRNTKSSNPNLDIENLRSKLTRSFSDNLLLEGLDSKKLVLENPQPSREGLDGGWETTSEFGFYEKDSSSSSLFKLLQAFIACYSFLILDNIFSVHSAIRDEDHFRGTESRQMFPGSSSTSDSRWLDDVPGFSHSYSAKFTTAEEMFERSSSMSSDNMYKSFTSTTGTDHPSDPDQPADGIVLVPGFSIDFIQWTIGKGAEMKLCYAPEGSAGYLTRTAGLDRHNNRKHTIPA
ncbi:hypothetical protein HID58_083288, partial [Brassica napus]